MEATAEPVIIIEAQEEEKKEEEEEEEATTSTTIKTKTILNMPKIFKLVKSRRESIVKGLEAIFWLSDSHKTGKMDNIDPHYLWSAHYSLLSLKMIVCHETELLRNILLDNKEDQNLYLLVTSDDNILLTFHSYIKESEGENGYIKALESSKNVVCYF